MRRMAHYGLGMTSCLRIEAPSGGELRHLPESDAPRLACSSTVRPHPYLERSVTSPTLSPKPRRASAKSGPRAASGIWASSQHTRTKPDLGSICDVLPAAPDLAQQWRRRTRSDGKRNDLAQLLAGGEPAQRIWPMGGRSRFASKDCRRKRAGPARLVAYRPLTPRRRRSRAFALTG